MPDNTIYKIISRDLNPDDFERQYSKLKQELRTEKNMNYDELIDKIGKAAEMTRLAGNLYVAAKESYKKFEEVELPIWWAEVLLLAEKDLEKLKAKKEISGQITEEKMKNWVRRKKPKTYKRMMDKLRRLRTTRDMLEILYKQWEGRKSLLQTQGNVIKERREFLNSRGKL